ncbi:ABC transporter permease [Kiritimatiellaeota bacterium B1221]|nr:ABC transporter permease [Kiritimatiellaeota bacterium B1221]
MIGKLVWKGMKADRLRTFTAVIGVVASTGLLVWSIGFLTTSMAQTRNRVERMSGPYSHWVSPVKAGTSFGRGGGVSAGGPKPPLRFPEGFAQNMSAVDGVDEARLYTTLAVTLDFRPEGRPLQGPPIRAAAVESDGVSPFPDAELIGRWPDPDAKNVEAVLSRSAFTPRGFDLPELGTTMPVISGGRAVNVTFVGYLDLREVVSGFPTFFVNRAGWNQLRDEDGRGELTDILLCQTSGRMAEKNMQTLLEQHDYAPWKSCLVNRALLEEAVVGDGLRNFRRSLPLMLTLSVLTALCMLVNALNMGWERRLLILSRLRCAGATKGQVACLVAGEGFLLAFIGWALGFVGGRLALEVFTRTSPELFPEGADTGWITPVISLGFVMLLSLLSLGWPILRTFRVHPLDAFSVPRLDDGSLSVARTLIGIALLFPMLILVLPLPLSSKMVYLLLVAVGIPLHLLGLWLSLPALMVAVETVLSPILAVLFRLNGRLLKGRMMRHNSFHAGMTVTLAVGLGMYTAIHIWGATLTAPFIPSATFPDVIVDFLPGGISNSDVEKIRTVDGVADGKVLPIEVSQFKLGADVLDAVRETTGSDVARGKDNLLLFGVDPEAAFGGENPLASFEFLKGSAAEAVPTMVSEEGCVITAMFSRQSGLTVGDEISFLPGGGRPFRRGGKAPEAVRLQITGVVDLNWHLVTSRAHLRGRNGFRSGTSGPVFVSEKFARKLTRNQDKSFYVWLNYGSELARMHPLEAGQVLEKEIRDVIGESQTHTVRVHHRDEIAEGTISHGANIIGDMARVPFYSMIILSFGMVTLLTGAAEKFAREIQVMRAVGMSRAQLGRLLISEALLTGGNGIALSLLSGICIGWTFTGLTRASMSFGGLPIGLVMPWPQLFSGIGFFILLCLCVSASPVWWILNRHSAERPPVTMN